MSAVPHDLTQGMGSSPGTMAVSRQHAHFCQLPLMALIIELGTPKQKKGLVMDCGLVKLVTKAGAKLKSPLLMTIPYC